MNPTALQADHPLQQAGLQPGVVHFDELQLATLDQPALISLHSLQPPAELNAALAASGWPLPERVNGAAGRDPAVLCLAPGHWLWFSTGRSPEDFHLQLRQQLWTVLDSRLSSLLDQSAAMAGFRLSGPAAAWVLSKCCGLDFRAASRQGQHCCRTRFGQVTAILHRHQHASSPDAFVFDLLVERSLARYSWELLQQRLPHARELQQQYGPLV